MMKPWINKYTIMKIETIYTIINYSTLVVLIILVLLAVWHGFRFEIGSEGAFYLKLELYPFSRFFESM
ncbi:hypothetical protein [Butyricimonas virosa]|jgi:hypothetical protein|uniref:hypothetical protein n=1 Tax=Butyricimonas virosa TaxID=544645 RepID=UPI00242A7228|nr:hypothetical protein [Butyricimonas virosa]MCI7295458.1 hypothetical protein [Butyricimonas virosa]MDY6218385.1 hypothetical protein [Butyricimonas virosa]